MSSIIQNYGFTKTQIQNNNNILNNEIEWIGNYDGKIANIEVDINDNGNKEYINMKLNNNDLKQLFGYPTNELPLEKRLNDDFLFKKHISLEGALSKRKTRKYRKKHLKIKNINKSKKENLGKTKKI